MPGSLQEALCILVFRYRQEQDFYGMLATLQPAGSEEQRAAFAKLRAAKFPYVYKTAIDERQKTQDALKRAFEIGPILIKPIAQGDK